MEKEYLERINEMSNEELFDEFRSVSYPDDYDGCYTKRGEWMLAVCQGLFTDRLISCGFLKNL